MPKGFLSYSREDAAFVSQLEAHLLARALEVQTLEQRPQDWAATQNHLGNALSDLAERSEGETGMHALNDAVSAFCHALELYTREQMPQYWAGTENNLGNAHLELAERSDGTAGLQALNYAVSAYRRAGSQKPGATAAGLGCHAQFRSCAPRSGAERGSERSASAE